MVSKRMMLAIVMALLSAALFRAGAQDFALSTNLAGYANLGTINMEASYGMSRHWSLNAGLRYNPFSFSGGSGGEGLRNRQRCVAVGARYWPWHIYSGWWFAGKAQYQEYNEGGLKSRLTDEGDRYGAGLTGGYSYMLGSSLNLELGLGAWAGYDSYTTYQCPTCGRIMDSGNRYFLLLNDVMVSLSYIF